MSHQIRFNKSVLKLISDLCIINPSIIIKKTEEGQIEISCANSTRTSLFRLSAPVKAFDFEEEKIAFFNFPQFFKYIDMLGEVQLHQDDATIQLKGTTGKITYRTADSDVIKDGPKKIPLDNPEASFILTDETIQNLNKIVGSLKVDNTRFTFDGTSVNLHLYSSNYDHSYDTDINLENEVEEGFSMVILNEVYKILPSGYNYQVDVSTSGLIRFSLINEIGLTVEIFTAETEEG